MSMRIQMRLYRDGPSGSMQLAIEQVDANGGGDGYRIFGTKFIGASELVRAVDLTPRDAREIKRYLDRVTDQEGGASHLEEERE